MRRETSLRPTDIWAAGKRAHPSISKVKITLKRQLRDDQRAERLAFAQRFLNVTDEEMERWVFCDEAGQGLNPTAGSAIAEKYEEVLEEDPRAGRTGADARPLQYLLAVNARVGIVYSGVFKDKHSLKSTDTHHQVSFTQVLFCHGSLSFNL